MTFLPHSTATAVSANAAKEVTLHNFMAEVVQASLQAPVMAYFHSPRFPACAEFGQRLQKVVAAAAPGKIALALVDIDKNREIAMQFRIETVPTVYVFHQGQPVDAFSGNLPEAELKKIIEKLAGKSPQDEGMEAALAYARQCVENGDEQEAEAVFRQILAEEAENAEALGGLAMGLARRKRLEEAQALLDKAPAAIRSHAAIQQAVAALSLAQSADAGEDESALRARLGDNPGDHETRFALANRLFAGGQAEDAIDALLVIYGKDRNWQDDKARKQLITYFEALGADHPLTLKGRRKLSTLMFS